MATFGSRTFGSMPFGGAGATSTFTIDGRMGFVTYNRIFTDTPTDSPYTLPINASKHKPVNGTWEELYPDDPRLENYASWKYPFNEGKYDTNKIDLGQIYYGARLNVVVDWRPLYTEYASSSYQMNRKGRVNLDIRGTCDILPAQTRYKAQFGSSDPDQIALLTFKSFWIDNTQTYVYVYVADKDKHALQKRRLSDLSLVDEVMDTDVVITAIDDQSLGITGDGTYIYYTLQSSGYVIKRQQSDLVLVAKATTFNALTLVNPLGIWTDNTNLFICDTGRNRVIKSDMALTYVSDYTSAGSAPTRIWGDSTNVYTWRNDSKAIIKITQASMALSATSASTYEQVTGICADGTSNIYIVSLDGVPYQDIYSKITKMETTTLTTVSTVDSLNGKSAINLGMIGGAWQFASNTMGGFYNSKIYITFRDKQIIDQMNTSLGWVGGSSLPTPSVNTLFSPQDIVGNDNYLYIADYVNDRLTKIDAKTLNVADSYTNTNFKMPYGLCIDDQYLYCIALVGQDYLLHKFQHDFSLVATKTIENLLGYADTPYAMCNDSNNLYILGTIGLAKIDKNFALVSTSTYGSGQIANPTDAWSDGTNIYVTNRSKLAGNYKISIFNTSLTYLDIDGFDGTLNKPAYGIYGDAVAHGTYDGYLYISTFDYNASTLYCADYDTSGADYLDYNSDRSHGNYGLGKDRYNFPHGMFVNTDYLYIADSLNDRIVQRKKNTINRIKLKTDESMADGLPTLQDDYYRGYRLVLTNHPDARPALTRRLISNYSGTNNNVRFDDDNPLPITQELTGVGYKMRSRSHYFDEFKQLVNPPVIKVRVSDKDDLDTKEWEMYSPQKIYDEIRYYRVRAKFVVKDHQTNVEVDDIKHKVKLTLKRDSGKRIGIDSSGTKVPFNIRFNYVPKIRVKTYTASTALYETIEDRSLLQANYPPYGGFTTKFRDASGTAVTNATIEWEWECEEY